MSDSSDPFEKTVFNIEIRLKGREATYNVTLTDIPPKEDLALIADFIRDRISEEIRNAERTKISLTDVLQKVQKPDSGVR